MTPVKLTLSEHVVCVRPALVLVTALCVMILVSGCRALLLPWPIQTVTTRPDSGHKNPNLILWAFLFSLQLQMKKLRPREFPLLAPGPTVERGSSGV